MAESTTKNYLDPKVINKIAKLELRARLIVEGFVSGQHKSPYRGFSVEFAQHREYVPGDDPACLVDETTTLRAWTGEAGRA